MKTRELTILVVSKNPKDLCVAVNYAREIMHKVGPNCMVEVHLCPEEEEAEKHEG